MSIASRILYLEPLADLRSDEWLVRAARSGNSEAASTLFRRYHGRVLAFISHMTGGRSNAEDITQETFIRALGSLNSFDGRHLEAWLLRIARNLVIDEARRDHSRPTPVPPEELVHIEPTLGRSDRVWDLYSANIATSAVYKALEKLPVRQRSVIVLREIEGRARDEIAEILGTNPHAVDAMLTRARRRFRVAVAQNEADEVQETACRRTMFLITEGLQDPRSALETRRHIRSCDSCRGRASNVRSAERAFGFMPLLLAKPIWTLALGNAVAAMKPAAATTHVAVASHAGAGAARGAGALRSIGRSLSSTPGKFAQIALATGLAATGLVQVSNPSHPNPTPSVSAAPLRGGGTTQVIPEPATTYEILPDAQPVSSTLPLSTPVRAVKKTQPSSGSPSNTSTPAPKPSPTPSPDETSPPPPPPPSPPACKAPIIGSIPLVPIAGCIPALVFPQT